MRLHDPAGATPIQGRPAIREHFAAVLTEPRETEIVLLVVTGHAAAITSMQVYASEQP